MTPPRMEWLEEYATFVYWFGVGIFCALFLTAMTLGIVWCTTERDLSPIYLNMEEP